MSALLFTIAAVAISSVVQHKMTKKRIESNSKLRELREEYARKRQEQQHELAMRLLREGQQLQKELQQELFEAQMEQVKTSFMNELQLTVEEFAYGAWPLKVLPWVIQNQSMGNLLYAGDGSGKIPEPDRFALHCILLPSSSPSFNGSVWLPLERKLEAFCNQYWNSSTGRPVLFYSGSWGRIDPTIKDKSRGIQRPASNDVGTLYDNLKQLPTIIIQPDFDFLSKKLKVIVTTWGMPEMEGKLTKPENPTMFKGKYTSEINYRKEIDVAKDAVKELVPYLESLIGYMADTYFWHASNAAPLFPSLIQKGAVNTEGMPYIRESAVEFYNDMLRQVEEEATKDEFFSHDIPSLFRGVSVLWDREEQLRKLTSLYIQHVNRTTGRNYPNLASLMFGELNMATPRVLPNSMGSDDGKITIECNGVKFDMIKVEHGTFWMGATEERENPRDNEKPPHKVYITDDYYIGEVPVTQALWRAVMNGNPSRFGEGGNGSFKEQWEDLPVEVVSWHDCQEFIKRLNEMTGKKFRLPTEAEWEFAARGGNKSNHTQYSGSNNIDEVAWYNGNSGQQTHPVKQKKANELGLYDMSGNVWEWCQDWFGSYSSSAQTNPQGPSSGSYRVNRGGSWYYGARCCRSSYRFYDDPSNRIGGLGLRLAL